MNKLKKRNPGILLMAFLFSLMAGFSQQASSQVNQVDFTSQVPVFHFSKNLKEQEEQLKKNPVLLRFAECV